MPTAWVDAVSFSPKHVLPFNLSASLQQLSIGMGEYRPSLRGTSPPVVQPSLMSSVGLVSRHSHRVVRLTGISSPHTQKVTFFSSKGHDRP